MGTSHPLDGRSLPRHGRFRPARRLARCLGGALLALTGALGAQDDSPEWNAYHGARQAEFRALRARLAEPAQRAEALAELGQASARLAREVEALALPLAHKAHELGTSELPPDERRAWLERARRAASVLEDPALELLCAQALALELESEGQARAALGVLEETAARRPGAGLAGLYLGAQRVELARRTGDPVRAVELADELLASPASEADGALLRQIERSRDYAWLDLGLPDLAWPGVLRRAEEGDAAELVEARLQQLHLLLAVGDERVPEEAARLLALAPELAASDAARFELLAAASEIGARSAELVQRGRARLAALPELPGEDALFAALLRADGALQEHDEAALDAELAHARALCTAPDTPEGRTLAVLDAQRALARGASPAELTERQAELARALASQLDEWRRLPARAGGFGYLLYGRRRELIGTLAGVERALHGAEPAARAMLERVLELQELGQLARETGAPRPSLARLRATVIGSDAGLLVYLPANPRSFLLWLDADALGLEELPAGDELDRRRGAYLAQLLSGRDAGPDETVRARLRARERELAAELSEALLPTTLAARLARWTRLAFANQDLLGTLPFEWLPLGAAPYLGVEKELQYLPSLPLAARGASARPGATSDYLLVGGALPGEVARAHALSEVPLDDALAAELCAPFATSRVLSRAFATRAGLSAADLDATRVLQFLVHGVELPRREHALALLLSPDDDDGLLSAADVRALGAPALVLLTGCRTGAGPLRKGDALAAELAGAWLAAGTDAVLVARSDLDLAEVRRFSHTFTTALTTGAPPTAALRLATAEAATRHGPDAPFRAGLLQLLGNAHTPLFQPDPQSPRPLLLTTLAGVLLGALLTALLLAARSRNRGTPRSSAPPGPGKT